MFTPEIGQFTNSLATRMQAGGGVASIEGRVKQLEAMIQAVEGRQAQAVTPASFRQYLNPANAGQQAQTQVSAVMPNLNFKTFATHGPVTFSSSTLSQASNLTERMLTFRPMVEATAAEHGIDPELVMALIKQESGFNPTATSKAGAQGLMQLMPATAKSLGVTNPLDPQQNLAGGVRYLKGLLDRYNGNVPLALAAYNAGPGAVKKYGGIPPYKETQQYVRSILSAYLSSQA